MQTSSSRVGFLSGRGLAIVLAVVGIVGALAFFRTHSGEVTLHWTAATTSTQAPLASSQVSSLNTENQAQEIVAERVGPAVVYVNVTAKASAHPEDQPDDNPLSQFFGPNGPMAGRGPRQPEYEQGLGSGVIISPDGFIVTNNHVVEGASDIRVTLKDKHSYAAKIIGADALTDLAIIKIDASGLPNLPWGDSRLLKQGDTVFAFGDPFGFTFTMTRGIVSGLGRVSPNRSDAHQPGDFIQTDATINPGNSGGPLVNIRGEVVGINAFIYTSTGSFSGESFAIPSEVAQPTTKELLTHGKVVRGYIGVSIADADPELAPWFHFPVDQTGAMIQDVEPDTPASKAGLQSGDIIATYNGAKVNSSGQLQVLTGQTPANTKVNLGVLRDGKLQTIAVTVGALPQDVAAKAVIPPAAPTSTGVQFGVTLLNLTPEIRSDLHLPDDLKGAAIEEVTPGGPAFNTGLDQGDVITEVNRNPVTSAEDLLAQLHKIPAGQDVLVRVYNAGSAGTAYLVVHPTSILGDGDTISSGLPTNRHRGGGGGR